MTRDEYRRVREVFVEVRRRSPAERAAFLDEACRAKAEMRTEVESLLAQLDAADSFLGTPAAAPLAVLADFAGMGSAASPVNPPASARHKTPATGTLPDYIGHYRILACIGRGGMGVVYRAEQEKPRRTVAVKVLRPDLVTPERLRRFECEAQVLGFLQHPGIAQVFEAGQAQLDGRDVPFFAMELVEGLPITEHAATSHLNGRQRLALLANICDAVHYAHQRGVIHRDLKPANILVDQRGQPKILDFGVARVVDMDLQLTTLQSDVGQLIGTVPYMSPEQVAGDPYELDVRSDVYALGVTGYELLSGRLPHDVRHKNLPEVLRSIREEEPVPLGTVSPAFRGDLDTIINKALEKDKSRRYASASEMAADVWHYLRDEPIAARPASALYRLRKFARRNRALAGGLIGVAIALSAGLVATTTLYLEAEAARRAAVQERERKEAETARALRAEARAAARFDEVRQLARAFIFDVHDQIMNLPGARPARELLVKTALQYLDRLAQDAGDDAPLRHDLATAYLKIGDVQGNPGEPNLGDLAGALARYDNALRLYRELVRLDPQDRRAWRGQAVTHNKIGDVQQVLGRADEATGNYEAGREIVERLATEEPTNQQYRRDLMVSFGKIGDVQVIRRQLEEARVSYERGLAIAEARAAADPTDSAVQRDVMMSHYKLGNALELIGQSDEALAHYQRSYELAQARAAAQRDDARARRDVFINALKLGDAYAARHEPEQALIHFQTALRATQETADADPRDRQAQRDLALAWGRVGMVQRSLGNLAEASVALERNLDLAVALAQEEPTNTFAQRDLAYAHLQLAELLLAAGHLAEAREHFEKDFAILEALASSGAAEADVQLELASACRNLAEVSLRAAKDEIRPPEERGAAWHAARRWLQRSLDINNALRERDALPPTDAQVPDELRALLAECDAALASLQGAAPADEQQNPPR